MVNDSFAKSYLRRIAMYDAKINSMIEEVDHLKQMVLRVTPALKQDVVSGGSFEQDKIGATVAKIIDLQNEINRCVDEFVDARNQVCAMLGKLDDKIYYSLLYKHYVLHKSLEWISCEMNYSYRHTCRLHGEALQAFEKILKEGADNG